MPVHDYDHAAAIYDPLLNPFLDPLRQDVTRLLKATTSRTVLDLCCGTGRQAILLHEAGFNVTGVDLSSAMLRVAQAKSPKTITYHETDAASTGLIAKSFDAVVLSLCLHELKQPQRQSILNEARRLLSPSGTLMVMDYRIPTTLAGKAMLLPIRAIERLAGREHHACFREFMQGGATLGLLEYAGLDAVLMATHMRGCIGIYAYQRL